MDFGDRRELNNGFGDALSRAFDLAVTPLVFGFFGWLLDRWLGTTPLFMLVLGLTTLTYMFWKMWSQYDAKMREHDEHIAEIRSGGRLPERGEA
jgi:F0F1-type ATP synthase assembly protein I